MIDGVAHVARERDGPTFKAKLERWLREDQRKGNLMVAEVLLCLNEEHQVALPKPTRVQWPAHPQAYMSVL
jgi:hypothetical protein